MHIAIIGTGSVGSALARGWVKQGHSVILGGRDPGSTKLRPLLSELGASAGATSVAEAVRHGEAVALATPWDATLEIVRGAGELGGKVVIDTTNPLAPGLGGLTVGPTSSAAEEIARAAPGARVVKCFNTTGANNYLAPRYAEGAATMFYCGDDAQAKATVKRLGEDLGFDMVDAGPLAQARLLEPLALLWITLAYPGGMGREIAFRLMRR
jgi:predicted dinucleotide-binding enzyme